MTFKEWIYMEIGGHGIGIRPPKQMIPITAVPGIYNKDEEPPKPAPTPTKGYEWTKRYMKKKCKKK